MSGITRYAFYVQTEVRAPYGHVNLRPCCEYHAGGDSAPYWTWIGEGVEDKHIYLPGFEITCQMSNSRPDDNHGPYAERYGYGEGIRIDRVSQARMVTKMLERIEKRTGLDRNREGMPSDYGVYALRVMRAAGAAGMFVECPYITGRETLPIFYNITEGASVAGHINWQCREVLKKLGVDK